LNVSAAEITMPPAKRYIDKTVECRSAEFPLNPNNYARGSF